MQFDRCIVYLSWEVRREWKQEAAKQVMSNEAPPTHFALFCQVWKRSIGVEMKYAMGKEDEKDMTTASGKQGSMTLHCWAMSSGTEAEARWTISTVHHQLLRQDIALHPFSKAVDEEVVSSEGRFPKAVEVAGRTDHFPLILPRDHKHSHFRTSPSLCCTNLTVSQRYTGSYTLKKYPFHLLSIRKRTIDLDARHLL